MSKRLFALLALLSLTLASNMLNAAQLEAGDSLPRVAFSDQHDQSHGLDNQIQRLIFAHTKQTATIMSDILMDKEPGFLKKRNAVYIADISGMPSIIARLFALPKLRKIDPSIYLISEPEESSWLPREEEKLTLLEIADGQITRIDFSADEASVRSMLDLPH